MVNKIIGFITGVLFMVLLSPFLFFIFSLASSALFIGLMMVSAALLIGLISLFLHESDKTIEIEPEKKHY